MIRYWALWSKQNNFAQQFIYQTQDEERQVFLEIIEKFMELKDKYDDLTYYHVISSDNKIQGPIRLDINTGNNWLKL